MGHQAAEVLRGGHHVGPSRKLFLRGGHSTDLDPERRDVVVGLFVRHARDGVGIDHETRGCLELLDGDAVSQEHRDGVLCVPRQDVSPRARPETCRYGLLHEAGPGHLDRVWRCASASPPDQEVVGRIVFWAILHGDRDVTARLGPHLDRLGAGPVHQAHHALRVLRGELDDRQVADVTGAGALFQPLRRCLEEHPDAVREPYVVTPDAGLKASDVPFLFVAPLVVPGSIPLLGERLINVREDLVVADQREFPHRVVVARALVDEVVRAGSSVMGIDHHMGSPLVDDVSDEVGDGRVFELHVVAVQIDAPRVSALPPVARFEAVGVHLRRNQDRNLFEERVGISAGCCQVPHEDHETLSKCPLATVDVGRQHDDGAAECPRLPRLGDQGPAKDGVRELPALASPAIGAEPHFSRRSAKGSEVGPHLQVACVGREPVQLGRRPGEARLDRLPAYLSARRGRRGEHEDEPRRDRERASRNEASHQGLGFTRKVVES